MIRARTVAPAVLAVCIFGPPAAARAAASKTYHLKSPNGRIEVAVSDGARLTYDVMFDGKPLVRGATLSLEIDHAKLGIAAHVTGERRADVNRTVTPPVRQKAATLPERYTEMRLACAGGYAVTFRAYDQGVAYRFETALPKREVTVNAEEAMFAFATAGDVYFPREESLFSHNERTFEHVAMASLGASALGSLPAVVETAAGPKVAIAESDVDDYPGLWLRGTGGAALAATFPPYPLEEKAVTDRDVRVSKAADYIAVTAGTRTFPWRVLGIAETDRELVASTLVYLLARPPSADFGDTSWIRPGKVAWDWWNDRGLRDVDFKPGVNTKTYERYIDFAAANGLEYVILDEGWYKIANHVGDLLTVVPELDMNELAAYARKKNVGLIMWVIWKTFDQQLQPALAEFERWGVKGVKVDFMQRDDQPLMRFYARVSRELARRKMLVDFHGGIRATLLARTYPNLVSTEGVRGLEHVKWSVAPDPEHDVTLPFTRMFLGPMDFTPGAMTNADRAHFAINFKQPMSLGTRCHQLAMYVVYESPLQMLADSPSAYAREPEAMQFLGPVPSTWDETRVLDGKIGDYVVVARRKGTDWWIGAMTDWTPRELGIDLGFLGEGRFQVTSYEDAPDADHAASHYRKRTAPAARDSSLTIKLAPGGGWAARINPEDQPAR